MARHSFTPIMVVLFIASLAITTIMAEDINEMLDDFLTPSFKASSLQISPSYITDPDTIHKISWSGLPVPTFNDLINLYIVKNVTDPTLPYPAGADKKIVGYYRPFEIDIMSTGSGSADLPVYLTRDQALYVEYAQVTVDPTTNTSSTKVLAHSTLCYDSGAYTVGHVHLARTHIYNQFLVDLITTAPSTDVQYIQVSPIPFNDSKYIPHNHLQFGVSLFYVNDTGASYKNTDMFEKPANTTSNWFHPGNFRTGLLSNLPATTRMWYRIIDVKQRVLSKTYTFITPQLPGSDAQLFIFGDLGIGFNSKGFYSKYQHQGMAEYTKKSIIKHIDQINKNTPNTSLDLLLIGDISYARGRQFMWEYFFKSIEPISSQIPFMVTIGNHEYDYLAQDWKPSWTNYAQDSGGEGGVPTFRYFSMPTDFHATPYTHDSYYSDKTTQIYKEKKEKSISYSYDIGALHIIVFSAEHDFTIGSAQYNFIEKDLKNVNRMVTPWVMVTSHRPMYCTSDGCSIYDKFPNPTMDYWIRQNIQPLLIKYKVNVYFAGHNHHFEHSCQMNKDYECADKDIFFVDENGAYNSPSVAPMHFLTGASGNDYEPSYSEYEPGFEGNIQLHHSQPDWCIFRTFTFGYSHILANQTHFIHTFYGNKHRTAHSRVILHDPIY